MTAARRYLVLRNPGSGPPALAGPPNDFATRAEAEARIANIEKAHLKAHHTFLDILPYEGDKAKALRDAGVLF